MFNPFVNSGDGEIISGDIESVKKSVYFSNTEITNLSIHSLVCTSVDAEKSPSSLNVSFSDIADLKIHTRFTNILITNSNVGSIVINDITNCISKNAVVINIKDSTIDRVIIMPKMAGELHIVDSSIKELIIVNSYLTKLFITQNSQCSLYAHHTSFHTGRVSDSSLLYVNLHEVRGTMEFDMVDFNLYNFDVSSSKLDVKMMKMFHQQDSVDIIERDVYRRANNVYGIVCINDLKKLEMYKYFSEYFIQHQSLVDKCFVENSDFSVVDTSKYKVSTSGNIPLLSTPEFKSGLFNNSAIRNPVGGCDEFFVVAMSIYNVSVPVGYNKVFTSKIKIHKKVDIKTFYSSANKNLTLGKIIENMVFNGGTIE